MPLGLSPPLASSPPWYKRGPASPAEPPDFDFLAGASTPLRVSKSAIFASPLRRLDKLHLREESDRNHNKGGKNRLRFANDNVHNHDIRHHVHDGHKTDDNVHNVHHNIHKDLYELYGRNDIHDEIKNNVQRGNTNEQYITANSDDETHDKYGTHHNAHLKDNHSIDHTMHGDNSCGLHNVQNNTYGNTHGNNHGEINSLHSDHDIPSPGMLDIHHSSNIHIYDDTHDADNSDSDYGAGDRTICSDSSDEPPTFIPRKRRRDEPLDMEITPNHTINMSADLLKISVVVSDSTPCPPQPRKRLRFKKQSPETTPSQPARRTALLNLSGSRKLQADALLHKLADAHADPPPPTPVSHSTPASSRAPSPCMSADDYAFVGAPNAYTTPQAQVGRLTAFHANQFDYEIVGEVVLDDTHVGDRRINDPYLMPPAQQLPDTDNLRMRYSSEDRLPLLAHFERDLTLTEMLELVTDGHSVQAFYDHIFDGTSRLVFLKKERLRWHPDKWVARIDDVSFDKAVVDALAQVISALIDAL